MCEPSQISHRIRFFLHSFVGLDQLGGVALKKECRADSKGGNYMNKLIAIAMAGAVAAIPGAALAEHHEEGPTIRENAVYLNVIMVDIKPGKRGRAEEIIDDYFVKASEAASTPQPILVHMQTGSWDFMVVWRMRDGPVELTYTSRPEGKKWFAALAEIAGGEDEARAIQEEYDSLVARSTSMIGHRHVDPE
jgi:hypothetical protein